MQAVYLRLADAALWPLSVWASFAHIGEHEADDYVERTSPILAFALAFWLIVGAIAATWFLNGPAMIWHVLWFFLPITYGIGLWMYSERQGRYPR